MNGNIRIGSLFGIPFYVNLSWFLVLALVTWDYGSGLAGAFPALAAPLPWLWGLATALLLFASVLAHELGHSAAALRQGIGVNSITLFLFGGLAALEKESDTPRGAFEVAIAGPLVSFALFLLLWTAGQLLPLTGPVAAIVALLSYINLALGVFNLIPGLPLDGGNVLKAAIWKLTDNPYRGIVLASRVGQLIGWAAILLGLGSIVGLTAFGSVWTLLIGVFLLQNAKRSAQSATLQERLSEFTAADAVVTNSPIVSATASLRDFADQALLGDNRTWQRFLVVDAATQLRGTVTLEALKAFPRELWATTPVASVTTSASELATIHGDRPLIEALQALEKAQISTLTVTQADGAVLGLLERASVRSLLQRHQAEPA